MTTDPLEVADLIDKAHDVLLDKGWNQGEYQATDGRVCSLGAIALASGVELWQADVSGYPSAPAAAELFRTVGPVQPLADGSAVGVAAWNDAPERTEDEVFDAFRQTSKRLREVAGQ